MCGNFEDIYGINLKLKCAEQLGISNNSINVNNKLIGVESTLIAETNTYDFSWVDGQGLDIVDRLEILTLTFSIDKYTSVGEYVIQLLSGTYIVDGNLSKVVPIIIDGYIIIA